MTQLIVRTDDDGKHYAIEEIYFACYRALSEREVKLPTCTSCRSMREWRYCSNNSNNVTRRWWVASLPPRPHYPQGKTPDSDLIEVWVNPKTCLDAILFISLTVSLASLALPYFMYSTSKWWDVISVVRGHAERLVLPFYFNQTRICCTHVSKNPEFDISRKSVRENSSCSIRRERTVGVFAFQQCFVHDT